MAATYAQVTFGPVSSWFGDLDTVKSVRVQVSPVVGGKVARLRYGNQTLIPDAHVFTDNGTGVVSFRLHHVDQDGFATADGKSVTMWAYKIIAQIVTASGSKNSLQWLVQPIQGQTEIDLDSVPTGEHAHPVLGVIPAVTSINGQTGAVTVDGTGAAPAPVTGTPTAPAPAPAALPELELAPDGTLRWVV